MLVASVLAATDCAALAVEPAELIVGAIRWDGWYRNGSVVKQMEVSLGQRKYHFRLPWFARVLGDDKVSINGDSQAVVEQEIGYAAQAGLNYWAFVDYWSEAPEMHIALNHYLAAKDKRAVRYCLVEEGSRLDRVGIAGWPRLVEHFRCADYQTVLDGRPLLFVFVRTAKLGKTEWNDLKRQTIAAGMKPPYLVLMGWNPDQDAKDMAALGFDAVSAYARGGSYSMSQPSYAAQCAMIRRDRWAKCRDLRIPSVTFASAGWDTRPRNERPPSWMKNEIKAEPDPTPPSLQKPLVDDVTATAGELAAHIHEHDEGGWLQPTLRPDGKPDESRIESLKKVLTPPTTDKATTNR
jgi:hypothetical protein